MKKTSKLIASLSLSLLTIGAMAQSIAGPKLGHLGKPKAFYKPVSNKVHIQNSGKSTHSIASTGNYGHFDYPAWDDEVYFPGAYQGSNENNGWFSSQINQRTVITDSTNVGGGHNYELLQYFTVAYDSLYDWVSQTVLSNSATSITSIDTVWALCSYKNTTAQNDTLILQGLNTTATGLPGTTTLWADTVILGPAFDSLVGPTFGDSLDAGYMVGVLPNYVPTMGNAFAISVKFYGSKLDTFELFSGFPFDNCTNEYAIPSHVGLPASVAGPNYANTFVTGFANVFGSATTVPSATNGWVWYGVQCGDTTIEFEQDAALFVSFTYSEATGIDNIKNNNISVNQNYPNPFNQTTQITYNLVNSSDVVFTVCDITGRELVNNAYGQVTPGQHQINLSANSFSPGVYFYTFNVNGNKVTKKMVITE